MSYLQDELPTQEYGLKFLFIGLAQAGKSSIIKVVFEQMQPEETSSLKATVRFNRHLFDFSGYSLNVYDAGGQISYLEEVFAELREAMFSWVKGFFFVIDTSNMDQIDSAANYYKRAIAYLKEYSKEAQIRILAHKFDLLPDKEKEFAIRKIKDKLSIEEDQHVKLVTTSIYSQSIFEAIKSVL